MGYEVACRGRHVGRSELRARGAEAVARGQRRDARGGETRTRSDPMFPAALVTSTFTIRGECIEYASPPPRA